MFFSIGILIALSCRDNVLESIAAISPGTTDEEIQRSLSKHDHWCEVMRGYVEVDFPWPARTIGLRLYFRDDILQSSKLIVGESIVSNLPLFLDNGRKARISFISIMFISVVALSFLGLFVNYSIVKIIANCITVLIYMQFIMIAIIGLKLGVATL